MFQEPLISREELTAMLFAMTREGLEERLKREREFREIMQRRVEVDQRLAAARRQQQQR